MKFSWKRTRGPVEKNINLISFPDLLWNSGIFFSEKSSKLKQRTEWNSNINWPPILWSVNPILHYKSSIFGLVHLKWYISHCFEGLRRFMLWALTKNWSIFRPYNSDFLLATTSFITSWIMMKEMCMSSHKGKYSGHLKICPLQITWQ